MPEIDGKQVTFRDPGAAFVWRWLPKVFGVTGTTNLMEYLTFDEAVELVSGLVESWEFDGDPHERETYEGYDAARLMNEFWPALRESWNYLVDCLNAGADAAGE